MTARARARSLWVVRNGRPGGYAVARARWRRCLAFSLALRLLARIVLLDLVVFFISGSDLSPYRAKAGCTTSVATLRTRLAPSGMMPALSWL